MARERDTQNQDLKSGAITDGDEAAQSWFPHNKLGTMCLIRQGCGRQGKVSGKRWFSRRCVAFVAAFWLPTVVVAGYPGLAASAASGAAAYGYPYPNAPDCNELTGANCVPDQWGFVQGQCHSWVAYRLNELNSAELRGTFTDAYRQPAGQEWGDAWHWGAAAGAAGIAVDDRPALGSVAWWSGDGGHVAYVESVNSDGSVTISEMNLNLHNGFDVATLRRGGRWPDGFIHIADRTSPSSGYWLLANNGTVYPFGGSHPFGNGDAGSVAIAARRDGRGYWTVDAWGGVGAHGAARVVGARSALQNGETVRAISATPSGGGYWVFSSSGRVFPAGDAAARLGDLRAVNLTGSIVGATATPSGRGYYMVGSDGGVFAFGDARFFGSTARLHLVRPVVGIVPTADAHGYWLVAADGGVFAFGDARFRGSMGGRRLVEPVVGMVPFGNGYAMIASDGGVFDFSNRPFSGSLGGQSLRAPVVGIAAFG
jgi:surface antigen